MCNFSKNPFFGKKKTIKGRVEKIDNQIYGWAIHYKKKPLKLFLQIDGVKHAVSASWHDRADVATKLGDNAFLKSGFSIEIPNSLIDTFLQARQNNQTIDVIANNVLLKNLAKKTTDAVVMLLPGELGSVDFQTVFDLNAKRGIEITQTKFQDLIHGYNITYPLWISADNSINADYYFDMATRNLAAQHNEYARVLLKVCLSFEQRAEFLELLGNTYFEAHDYETAAYSYQEALTSKGNVSKWLFSNLASCKKLLTNPRSAVEVLLSGIDKHPDFTFLHDHLDGLIQNYWLKQLGALEVLSVTNNREALLAKTNEVAAFIYQAYLHVYGASQNPEYLGSCNLKRVLIVGDFHVAQCVRYRIEQKIEQLEANDVEVSAISWTDLATKQQELAFHDVVIFYRVPAEPAVLKAMAQVNATGKLSFYEIDDLLFDSAYPPALETYGGYLELETYLQLLKGMASFNAAARYCRFGIASTQPLVDKLAALVFGKQCFLHRNGIDSLNTFKLKPLKSLAKSSINIFYGSGTMAHNSDFTDLALPAIMRILDEHPNTFLMIAGYLKLPGVFLETYEGRVQQRPPVKSVKDYWSLLEQADINLAVLHDDEINGCKSELKWFEAACLDIPSIVSNTANYCDVIRDGEDGLIAATTEDWYQHLNALVNNPVLRHGMAEKARLRTQAEYSIEALSANITTVLAQALSNSQIAAQPKRKKIALVNVFFPPQAIGGATRVVSDNFDFLQKNYSDKFELCVFTSNAEHKAPYQIAVYNYQGIRVYRSSVLWRENMDWHSKDNSIKQLFGNYLAVERPDLIHFHCIQRLTASVVEAAQEAKIPYIVTVHDAWWISDYQFLVDADNNVYPEGHPDLNELYLLPDNVSRANSIERIHYLKGLLHQAHEVLTVSEAFARIYQKNGIPQVQVNKNGISETVHWQEKVTLYTDKVVCGHVGGMSEHKGYFLLKTAVEELQPKNIELLIVDHSKEEGYRHKSHWGKVLVTFIGRVSQTDVVELYQQIDVLFAPSIWPESYGLVTREAAACGCWIVASNMGGIGEDVVEGVSGFVIDANVDALSKCLEQIDEKIAKFKGKTPSSTLRRVTEQVKELAKIYSTSVE